MITLQVGTAELKQSLLITKSASVNTPNGTFPSPLRPRNQGIQLAKRDSCGEICSSCANGRVVRCIAKPIRKPSILFCSFFERGQRQQSRVEPWPGSSFLNERMSYKMAQYTSWRGCLECDQISHEAMRLRLQ